ncbi:MAG: hypothetical protein R3Y56_10740 [Akkermansia sp.]
MKAIFFPICAASVVLVSGAMAESAVSDVQTCRDVMVAQLENLEALLPVFAKIIDAESADLNAPVVKKHCEIFVKYAMKLDELREKIDADDWSALSKEFDERKRKVFEELMPVFDRLEKNDCYDSDMLQEALDSTR